MTFSELKARVDAAEGADREIDLAIWNATNHAGETWRWIAPQGVRGSTDGIITCDRYEPGASGNPVCSLDEYTSSLDAALGLVDARIPGRDIVLEIGEMMTDGVVRRTTDATIYAPAYSEGRYFTVYGSSPALALLSALLSALIAEQEEKP